MTIAYAKKEKNDAMHAAPASEMAHAFIRRQIADGRAVRSGVVVTFQSNHADAAARFVAAVQEIGGTIREIEDGFVLRGASNQMRTCHEVVAYLPYERF